MKLLLLLLAIVGLTVTAARLKDIASLKGVRDNQLLGYGIVIGLSGTGDKSSELTSNSLGLVLRTMGVDLKSKNLETKNTAAVICSAVLPPFARSGSRLDVTVSAIGGASSLDGGNLLITSLRGPDGQIYAMAQGKIMTIKRGDGKGVGQTLVTAQVPGGAILEKEIAFDFSTQREMHYYLQNPDFTTAARAARRINEELGGKYATATDAASIDVILPYSLDATPVETIAQIERIDIEADRKAKVVINPRTGTVVLGENVRILGGVGIAHNNLQIEIKDTSSKGSSNDNSKTHKVMVLNPGPSIAEIAGSLNEIGASADDLVALIQSLKTAGALTAEIEIQ